MSKLSPQWRKRKTAPVCDFRLPLSLVPAMRGKSFNFDFYYRFAIIN